jgi:hypothetical protein
MKNFALGLVVSGIALYASGVSAQVCNGAIASTISAAGTVNGNSCQAVQSISNACVNQDPMNGAGEAIYALTVGTNNAGVTLTVNSTGTPAFSPYVALQKPDTTNGCDTIDGCTFDSQSNVGTTTETGTLPTASAAGTYYVIVADTNSDTPGCGAFSLVVAGTLPVQLQNFSVN